MAQRFSGLHIPELTLFLFLAGIPGLLMAQFEQKLSLNLSGGYFNTIGKTGWDPGYVPGPDDMEPTLMPNFTGGPSVTAGIQYNFSRHFSLEFQAGYSYALSWYYDYSDDDSEPFNYLYYEIYNDTVDYTVIASGENEMDMFNFHLGIAPRYYFRPGSLLNPYLFAGISLNITDDYFQNNEKAAYQALGRLEEYEENPELVSWFEWHTGIGMIAGAGVEFALNDYLGLIVQTGYHFIPLKEEAFFEGHKHADFHALQLHLGARISFLKSKEL